MISTQVHTKRSTYQTLFAWIFALLFVISAIGVIFSFFPVGKILDPEFYQQAMVEVDLYQRLPEAIANQLATEMTPAPGDTDTGLSLVVLSDQEWQAILVDLIDPEWLQAQSEQVIDQFFDLLLVSQDPVNTPIEISVSEIKESIAGTKGIQAINQIIAAQPPCTLDQLVGLVQAGLGMENSVGSILCKPPDFILSEINPVVETFLTAIVGQIPETFQFYIPFSQLDSQASGTSQVEDSGYVPETIQRIRQVNTLISWSPLLPLSFLLLMTLAAVRSLKDFMAWWGGAIFTAGSISLVFSAIFAPAATWVFARYLPIDLVNSFDVPELLVDIGITDFYTALFNQLQLSIIMPAVTMTAIGFALLLGRYLLSRNSPNMKSQPASSQVVQ